MFSEVLKSLRLKAGLTQTELAEKLKVGKSTISMYENGSAQILGVAVKIEMNIK